jgi:TRAP-type C4-dicarboxylate transport system permease small subunit
MQNRQKNILPSWFLFVRTVVDSITSILNIIGTLLIVGVMVLVNSDVVGRGVFNSPISGVPEIVSMSIVAIVFLQVAQAFRKGRLTRSEAFLNFVGKYNFKFRSLIDLIFSLAAIGLIWKLLAASGPLFVKAWTRNTFEGTVGDFIAPIWPVKLIILVGCTALLAQLILYAIKAILELLSKQEFSDDTV